MKMGRRQMVLIDTFPQFMLGSLFQMSLVAWEHPNVSTDNHPTMTKKTQLELTLQGTNISFSQGMIEDDFPFPKVGYVSFKEGKINQLPQRNIPSRYTLPETPKRSSIEKGATLDDVFVSCLGCGLVFYLSGQIIATSHDRFSPYFREI